MSNSGVTFPMAVKAAMTGASKDKMTPILVSVRVDPVRRIAYATDRYRVVVAQWDTDVTFEGFDSEAFTLDMVGAKAIAAVKAPRWVTGDPVQSVTRAEDGRVTVTTVEDARFTVGLVDDNYPPVLRLFDQNDPPVTGELYGFTPDVFGVVATASKALGSTKAVAWPAANGKPRLFTLDVDGKTAGWVLVMPLTLAGSATFAPVPA